MVHDYKEMKILWNHYISWGLNFRGFRQTQLEWQSFDGGCGWRHQTSDGEVHNDVFL